MRVRLGVSACLLGQRVRWNGGHEEEPFLTQTLQDAVEWVPVCPEVEIGLGVPRPTVRLEEGPGGVRLVEPKAGTDHTQAMHAWSSRFVGGEAAATIDGFVLKRLSPSCGPDRVRVHRAPPPGPPSPSEGLAGRPAAALARTNGSGLFATALHTALPLLPSIDDGRLNDPGLREAFFDRVFAHARLRGLGARPSASALAAFHARNKYTLLAHDPDGARRLGRIVADKQGLAAYAPAFMQALARPATRAKHANVLQHLRGFLKGGLDAGTQRELDLLLDHHKLGLVPLVVPVTLLRHLLRVHDAPAWARDQTYLEPYPMELMLRNHV